MIKEVSELIETLNRLERLESKLGRKLRLIDLNPRLRVADIVIDRLTEEEFIILRQKHKQLNGDLWYFGINLNRNVEKAGTWLNSKWLLLLKKSDYTTLKKLAWEIQLTRVAPKDEIYDKNKKRKKRGKKKNATL